MANTLKSSSSTSDTSEAAERGLAPRAGSKSERSLLLRPCSEGWPPHGSTGRRLSRLREAESDIPDANSGITEGGTGEDF